MIALDVALAIGAVALVLWCGWLTLRGIASLFVGHAVEPREDGTPGCPCHPYPGRAIFRPEWADKCRADCWTHDPDWPMG